MCPIEQFSEAVKGLLSRRHITATGIHHIGRLFWRCSHADALRMQVGVRIKSISGFFGALEGFLFLNRRAAAVFVADQTFLAIGELELQVGIMGKVSLVADHPPDLAGGRVNKDFVQPQRAAR
jgi:hypothetical protein